MLEEKVRKLEQEVEEKRKDVSELKVQKETMIYKLEQIEKQLDEIATTVQKDLGWRGFFIDFVKMAAQVAALLAAGKLFL